MNENMKKILIFVTVLALAIVAKSVWTSSAQGIPSVEIDVQFKISVNGTDDVRNES